MLHAAARIVTACLVAATAACSATPEPAPPPTTLESVIELHTRARGGRDAIEAAKAVQIDMTIEEGGFTVDGRCFATREGDLRIDVFADGERIYTEALDHDRSWSREAGDEAIPEPGSEQAAAALRHGLDAPFLLFGLHELPGRGYRLSLGDRERVGDVDYYVVRVVLPDGFETRYYLNPTTWLIERERQHRALHVDEDPRPEWIETEYLDYAVVAGVSFPFGQVERQLATGKVLANKATRRIVVNPALDPELFKAPHGLRYDE